MDYNYDHEFRETGPFSVNASISNSVSTKEFARDITIVEVLENLQIATNPPHAAINLPIALDVVLYRAPTGNDCLITVNYGGGIPDVVDRPRTGSGQNGKDTLPEVTYTTLGTKTITVTVKSPLESLTQTLDIEVQDPVKGGFTVTAGPDANGEFTHPGPATFTIVYTGNVMPTDASYSISLGDGEFINGSFATLFATVPGTATLSHSFTNDGTFSAAMTIYNLASSETTSFNTGSYIAIADSAAAITYKPALPLDAPEETGLLNQVGKFPRDRPIIFTMTHTSGTIEGYDISYNLKSGGGLTYTSSKTKSPFEIDFPGSGLFEVQITAKNPLYSNAMTTEVTILDRVVGTNITDLVPNKGSGVLKKFGIEFDIQGDQTCLSIDFGDGIQQSLSDDPTYCSPSTFQHIGALTGVTEIKHTYNANGYYTVVATAYNSFSNSSNSISVPVSRAECKDPIVTILDQSFQFYNPMIVKKGKQFSIIGQSDILCSTTLENIKTWSIETVDDNSGEVTGVIDLSSYSTRTNAELYIPARSLDYGLYKATYSMEMSGADFDGGRFVTASYTYFRVDESDIVGIIQQGGISEIVRGLQPITLEPHKWSFDPDDITPIGSQTFDTYTWNCTPANLNATVAHCDDMVPTTTVGSPVTVDLAKAVVNADFRFCVVIKKGTRATTACLVVQLVPGAPPDVYLECTASSVCNQLADGQLIPPSGRLGVKCECTSSSCANLQLEYSWIFYVYDYRWPWKDIRDIQKYAIGIDSKELAINQNLFEDYPEVTRFRAGCTANIAGHSEVGKAYMNFMINSKPDNGTCTVDKTEGVVSTNKAFCITCENWYDEQGIAEYQIIVRLKDDDVFREVMAVTTFDGPLCLDLPMGAKYNAFKEDLLVRIKDNLGSVREVLVSEVTVSPLSAAESQTLITQFLNNQFDPFDKVYAEGNTNTVAAITSNLVAILNSDSKKAQSEYAGVGVASSTTNTGFGPSDADRDGAFITSESSSNPVLNQKYEEEKDLRSQLKQQAVEALSKVTTGSVTAVKQISSSLSEFVHYPEEVTLKSATLAINKTLEMAKYMAELKDVSYEDRKSTFIYMAATLGGALDAIGFNGDNPSLTELDEAQDLPIFKIYDTDWENPDGGITAGNLEEAMGEHGKHTHKTYAGSESSAFIDKATETMLLLAQGFSTNSVPGESIPFTTNRLKGVVTNQDAKALLGNPVTIPDSNATLLLPNNINALFPGSNKTENDSFVLQLLQTTSVPYQYSEGSKSLAADSNGLVIDIFDDNGDVRVIKNLVTPIEFKIPRDVNAPVPKYKEADPFVAEWDYFYYHRVNITKKGASLHIQFDISNSTTKFLVVVKFGEFPDIEKKICDFVGVIPDDNMPAQYRYTYFLDNRNVSDFIGSVYIGVRKIIEPEEIPANYQTCADIPEYEKGSGKPDNKYNFRVFSTGCYFFNKSLSDWSTEGCWVGPETDEGATHCFCNHLTTFAGGWVVVPNTIDWNFIFSNADFAKNPTLYITEIVIAILYLFAVVWARREDKKDLERIGVTPLKDNDPRDKYYYEVVVITGMRRNAGTDSKVCFIMSGEHDETDVRMFTDDKRKIFRRGAVDSFLVAVPRPLGTLNYARVWHDNSGKGKMASWYLKYLMVRDIQTNQRSVFICNKWFAVEEDDGQVDRVIPVAGKAQMTEFGHLFAEKSKKSLIDGHLWFSVVARPAQSRFTRVQRVSCCLLLLFVSMLGNAMFYGTATSSSTTYTFGPFALSPEQIFIGIAVNLIIFPINFFVMTLFRKSRARKMKPSRIDEALKRGGLSPASNAEGEVKSDMGGVWMSRSPTMMAENRAGTSASMRPETSFSSVSRMGERNYEALRVEKKKKKKKFEFPWWCSILGWILLWLGVGVSVAFVTFYGITFQDEKCKKWITSMLTSFFTSVFITQPVKVFLTAIFFSLVVKNPGEEEEDEVEDEEAHKLGADEEYLHFEDGYGATRPRKIGYKPPDPAELEKARIQRLNEIKMWEIVREIVFYAFFLWILMVISYRNRSPDAYYYKDSLQKTFIENTETNHWFSKVRNTAEYWKWAKSGLLNGIRASNYYNSDPPLLLRGFVNDKVSRIMGYATMRQLRVRPGLCDIRGVMKNVIHECNEPYSLSNEDEETYMPEWKKLNSTQSENDTGLPWVFSKADVLNGYPYWGVLELYGGGGYVQRLQGSKDVINQTFKTLESQNWIDRYTRAVFVEFTIYNPQVNLFAIATIVAEFDASGGVTTSYRFEPAMLLPYMSSVMLFQIACEVIYLLFTAWFIIKAVKNIFKEKIKYFFVFWNIIELGIIAVSLGAVIVYFYRLNVTNELTAIFARSHGNEYMKFQYAGYWNEIFTYMIGWLVFFGTLKFLKLLRFNKRMALVAATLKNGSNSLIHFGIIFLIVYMAFMQLFYLTFMNLSTTFSTFVTSMESGVLMMMGKFDIYSMLMIEPFLTQLFVFCFVVTITFILVNMFLSILNETFGAVREDMNKVNNDYEIVDFMVGRFKRWTGIGAAPANTLQPSDLMTDAKGRPISGPQDNVTHFPDRIDKLLNSISNIYMDENGIARRMNQKEAAQNKSNMKSMFRGNSSHDNDGLTEVQN
ncbi:uncharacterized protein LOC126810750 isoform X1 [Patella vulgata]|uniref:uncharacterized protein LOC126810750 isoform X1 n=1 Tax=Patella vulgata TaxID=6465 RepID=UPI0024A925DF|nr:uncharacterized protein LOC126810750 isoform X1 [Patella vulgata]